MSKGKLRVCLLATSIFACSLAMSTVTARATTADDQDCTDGATAIADDGKTAVRGIVIPNG